jgi:uncharacterized protein YbjT (DUF2867 family)
MNHSHPILVTGAAGKYGGIGPKVVEDLLGKGFPVRAMVRREDERSAHLEKLGAQLVIGDLLELNDMHRAMKGVKRVYFSMSLSPTYLEATANVAAVAKYHAVDAFVNMSQMTVSQMNIHETTNSPQHKQHWLGETILGWSGLPVVNVRPTAFLDVLFLQFAAPTIQKMNALVLPFGSGKTSPIAAFDVARCVTEILANPDQHIGKVYELTGPVSQDTHGIAREFSQALGRSINYKDVPPGPWEERLRGMGEAMTPHLFRHLQTMAAINREGKYDRNTNDVEKLTGSPAMSVEQFVRKHKRAFEPLA